MKKKYSIASIVKILFPIMNVGRKCGEILTPKNTMMLLYCGGGHGLGTAYYLAKEHGVKNIAVIEKGWLGSETQEETLQS